MSDPYVTYFAKIPQKTGNAPEDGARTGETVAWLKDHRGLGHGHATAIVKWRKEHDEMK